jgi:hypothetical protein
MKSTLAALSLSLLATSAFAAGEGPGSHFVENWDLNEDGKVTLAEATERRDDVFVTFDVDDNGVLSPEEHDLFDEARANDMKENGMGHGKGRNNPANGMLRKFTDANNDGSVTHQEFMAAVPDWFARMDKNGDSVVTVDDFGR